MQAATVHIHGSPSPFIIISASLELATRYMLQAFRLDHLSVRGCEQWQRP